MKKEKNAEKASEPIILRSITIQFKDDGVKIDTDMNGEGFTTLEILGLIEILKANLVSDQIKNL